MKLYFIPLLLILSIHLSAQTKNIYTIQADSVLLTNCNDSTELIIENHTQGVPGFLYNTGKGRTAFKQALVKLNDTTYVIGPDTLKMRNSSPNAWLQNGNSFGATGWLGTKDNQHLDIYTNNQRRIRIDTAGNFVMGYSTYTFPTNGYVFDVNGPGRFRVVGATTGIPADMQAFDIRLNPSYTFGGAVDASTILFGNIHAYIGVNKATYGNYPIGSLIIGGSNKVVALADASFNPIFMINGVQASINGGYSGINAGGTAGVVSNSNALNFTINGGRGTGTGTVGDIILTTGNSQASGTTIHTMTNRWWIKGATGYLSNTSTPTSTIDLTGANGYSQFRLRTTYTPTSSADTNGNTGDFSWDGNYFYIKTAAGWKRAALTTF